MYKKRQAAIVAALIIIIIALSFLLLPARQPQAENTTTNKITTTQAITQNKSSASGALSGINIASNNYSINSSYSITIMHNLPSYAPYPYIYKNTTAYRISYSRIGNYSVIELFHSALQPQNTTLFAINSSRYMCVMEFNATSPVCYSQIGTDGANITTVWNNSLDLLTLDGLNITVPYYAPNATAPSGYFTISDSVGSSGAVSAPNLPIFNFSSPNTVNSSHLGNECMLIESNFSIGKKASGRIEACISKQYNIPLTYAINITLNASEATPYWLSGPGFAGFVIANGINISYNVTGISEISDTNQSAILPSYMRSYLSSNDFIVAQPRGS
jgi:hypothetical protein